jgi:DNA-binding CsgD family transcriptional regulator
VIRTGGATVLLERWFARFERRSNGLPTELLEWAARTVEAGRGASGRETYERGGPERQLKVTLTPLPERHGRPLWALLLQEEERVLEVPKEWRELLTPRELQVVTCILKGWDNRLIAEYLSCSVGTVKKHQQRVFDKLGMDSRSAIIDRATGKTRSGRTKAS